MADYFSQEDLENALSVSIVQSAYDDDQDGNVDSGPIASCIAYGNAECNSFMRNIFVGGAAITLPLTTVPDEVKFAALEFGIAYTMRRRPDLMRAIGEQTWTSFYDAAVAKMKRYCESVQRMPTSTGTHATAGGEILNPDSDANGDAEDLPDEGRWADLGDFA